MKIKTASLAAAAALLALTPAAFAADMPIAPPPIEAAVPEMISYDWTGFYVGVFGGYGWGEFDLEGETTDAEGGLAGGTVGYNMQFGQWVVGLEADGAWSGIDNDDDFDDGATYNSSLEWVATVRGRIGLAFDRFLVYGTGGLAVGEVELFDTVTLTDDSDTGVGFAVGGGVEYAMTDNISLKAEYLYINLDGTEIGPTEVDFDAHTVRGGINFRF